MNLRKVLICTIFLFIYIFCRGQNLSDTIHIHEIKILAKRKVEEAGLKITRLDSLQRASFIGTNLSELIAECTPVFVKSYGRGSTSTVSFRGTAATHTQIMWNGMKLNSPMRGFADISLLPVFFADNIYLLHGGSSLSKGSGALGGSILLENDADWQTKFGIGGMVNAGSFNSMGAFLKIDVGSNFFHSVTRAFYDGSKNDFPFYNSGIFPKKNDTLRNADYWKAGVLQEFYFKKASNRVSNLRLWYQQGNRNLPQLMSYQGSEREEYQNDKQYKIQYNWKKYSEDVNYHFFTGVNKTILNYYWATPEFNVVNDDSESKETGVFNHLRVFRNINSRYFFTISADVNYFWVNAERKLNEDGYKNDRLETSLLLDMHCKPSDNIALFLLIRSENYDKKIVPMIPSVGIEWQFTKKWPLWLRANVSRNYHKPTLNDLYWLPGGNPELLSEDGYSAEVSVNAERKSEIINFTNEVTTYLSKIENWITWQPALNGAYYWEANNVKEVVAKGIEYQFSTDINWRKLKVFSGGNYAYTNTTNLNARNSADKSRNKQLMYIPKHKGSFYFSAIWNKFTVKYDFSAVGKRYTNSSNNESEYERVLNPYCMSKISVGKKISFNKFVTHFKFTVDNLFNTDYQSILWRPMPGRYYNFSVAFNYREK